MTEAEAGKAMAEPAGLRLLPMRRGAVLVELPDLDATLALQDALLADPIEGIEEIIPAARTLLVQFRPHRLSTKALRDQLSARLGRPQTKDQASRIEIPVVYDGEDLAEVAQILGMPVEEVIRRHGAMDYVVAFAGFAPGFAYLAGGDDALHVPRRSTPRTRVPAGAVGLAGEFSGIYPKTSPGGWQLIGTTPLLMFDIDRDPPALLSPGMRVRFRRLEERVEVQAQKAPAKQTSLAPDEDTRPAIEIRSIGLPPLVQDLGRPGRTGMGIGLSGAADRGAHRLANRLVGNRPEMPALELTMGGLGFIMRGTAVMALAGAPAPIEISDRARRVVSVAPFAPVALEDGDEVRIGRPSCGHRSYLAFRGGLDVPQVLGSAATDLLAQIGPAAIRSVDRIPILDAPIGSLVGAPIEAVDPLPSSGDVVSLDVTLGPRTDWFSEEAVRRFLEEEWHVTPQSSRVGIRLSGPSLQRAISRELPSEGTIRGAIQVPADGHPVLFLADHPLTGGYPVIANIDIHHLDLAAQIPVGARIRFRASQAFAAMEAEETQS